MFKKPFALALLLSSFQPAQGLRPVHFFDEDLLKEFNDLSNKMLDLAQHSTKMLEDRFSRLHKTQINVVTEDEKALKVAVQLPQDFNFKDHKVELLDNNRLRLTATDDQYEVTVGSAYGNNMLAGHVKIVKKTTNENQQEKTSSEARFKHSLLHEINFEEVDIEYDPETATLTFSFPKKIETKTIKTVNVRIK